MTLAPAMTGSRRDERRSPDALARLLALGRPLVMGVLNVTPDSFSDGGQFFEPATTIVLDPGIGFGKTPEQSLAAIARLAELKSFGLPLLVGASRKRFIDKVSAAPPDQRIGGSIAAHLLAAVNGAAIIRTHDVAETV